MSNNDPTYALDPSKLPPALLAVVPALAPPPGVTPNFIDPPSREDLGKGFVYAFLPIMVCFVTLRMYTRARISRTFGLDDWTCVLAALSTIAYCVLILLQLGKPLGPHQWNVRAIDVTGHFSLYVYVGINLYAFSAGMAKISILLLYFKYFSPSSTAKYMIWTGLVLIGPFYLASIVANLTLCVPRRHEGFLSPTFLKRCNQPALNLAAASGLFGVLSDFYLLIIPSIQVMRLQISRSRKISLIAVFFTGFLACAFSLAGCIYRFMTRSSPDYTWTQPLNYTLSSAEVCIGITSSCMPVNFILFKSAYQRLSQSISSLRNSYFFKRSAEEVSSERSWPLPTPNQQQQQHLNKELPPVPKGTLVTLREVMRGVFGGGLSSVADRDRSTVGRSEMVETNLSGLGTNPGRDDYHVYLRGGDVGQRV